MRVVFLHGGPGLNGNPERHLLVDHYQRAGAELVVWDEPSSMRPAGAPFDAVGAWQRLCDSAEAFVAQHARGEPIALLAHSFGAWPAWEIARKRPELLRRVVYVAPGMCPAHDHRNTLSHVRDAFAAAGDEARAARMRAVLEHWTGVFDANAKRGWQLALECPSLFDRYWHDRTRMAEYLTWLVDAHAVDAASFFSVSASCPAIPPAGRSAVPATVVWGEHESIVAREKTSAMLRERHSFVTERTLPRAAHYPHIERMHDVLDVVRAD